MPRKAAETRSAQLLLRVTEAEFELIDSVAHLHRTSPNAYVYGLVKAHVEVLKTDPHVLEDRRNVQSFQAQRAATVDLDAARRTTPGHADDHQERSAPA